MSKIFIVTGVSGSGKTTLSNELIKRFNTLQLISLDDCKTELYDRYGFRDIKEKELAEYAAKEHFIAEVYMALCKGTDLVLEYPFNKQKWRFFFDELKELGSELYFINCIGHDFTEVWENRVSRDSGPERHLGLLLDGYIKDKFTGELIGKDIDVAKREYSEGKYIWDSEPNAIFFNYSNLDDIVSFVKKNKEERN